MTRWTRWLFTLFWVVGVIMPICLLAFSVMRQSAWAGRYECTGTDVDGHVYQATLEVQVVGEAYRLLWQYPRGATVYGIGIVEMGALVVAFRDGPGSMTGVGVYRQQDGGLHARWTTFGSEMKIMTETCLPAGARAG